MDKETGLYNFPQRYYDSRNVKWLTLDPIGPTLMTQRPGSVDGLNWYSYCNNNPIMYNDPDGLASPQSGAIPTEGKAVLNERESQRTIDSIVTSARGVGEDAMKNYNASNSYQAKDWVPGSWQSGYFKDNPERVEMNPKYFPPKTYTTTVKDKDGKKITTTHTSLVYQNYIHNGIDLVGGESVVAPGYYKILNINGDQITLNRIGTDSNTTLKHLNPSDLKKLEVGQILSPGEQFANYPSIDNSGGTHVHVQESRINPKTKLREFCSPNTQKLGGPNSTYWGYRYTEKADGTQDRTGQHSWLGEKPWQK